MTEPTQYQQAAPYTAQPNYSAPASPEYTPQPAQPTTLAHLNAFALVAIILGFMQPLAGIVFGHIALNQIKRNGDAGRGLALTGLIIGYISVAFIIIAVIAYISMIALIVGTMGAAVSELGTLDYPSDTF